MRTVDIEGKIHFVASDVAKALEYHNPSEAINDHCRWVAKCYILRVRGLDLALLQIIG